MYITAPSREEQQWERRLTKHGERDFRGSACTHKHARTHTRTHTHTHIRLLFTASSAHPEGGGI